MKRTRWAIITGDYPPTAGGVSDYTASIARGLSEAGDDVIVFTGPGPGSPEPADRIIVHRLSDQFGPRGLRQLDRLIRSAPRPDRILLQYVPHAYGWKGMNLLLAAWVGFRASKLAPLWVMFHEVAYPLVRTPFRHRLLARLNRLMARWIVKAAERVFVSIPAWESLLHEISRQLPSIEWCPIPSNITGACSLEDVSRVRDRYLHSATGPLIGHFGTYGTLIRSLLDQTIPTLLTNDPGRVILLLGQNGNEFCSELQARHPDLADRIHATGLLDPGILTTHIHACDWFLQPFVDGVSSRRTSLMAALALGKPIVTNLGHLSETIWAESGSVVLAAGPDSRGIIEAAEFALRAPEDWRLQLGRRGADVYQATFSLERTIKVLRDDPPGKP